MFRRFALLIAVTVPFAAAADVKLVEEIAAKVNGDIITRGELESQRRDLEKQMRAEGLTGQKLQDAIREYNQNSLRDHIDQLLLSQKGKDLNINVDGEVTRELADIQVRAKISDPDQFQRYIQEQTGMTYTDYKDQLKRRMLSQRVIGQEVGYRMSVPEAELRKYYEDHKSEFVRKGQVFLSQIVISTEGKNAEQVAAAETKAKDLVARARKGEKFSELVRENSDDPETSRTGGSLPPYERNGMLAKEMEETVFNPANKKGYITDPFKIPTGFVILRIDERYEAGQSSFEEVRSEIQEVITRPKMEPRIREFLTRLRTEAFLEIKDGYIDSGAAPGKDTRWRDVAQLKPQTTTKEEVAARVKRNKKILFIPIPGTTKKAPASEVSPAIPAPPPEKPADAKEPAPAK
jgi:peptidyl-prolyl cis-trans isomerase SurA